MLGKGGFLWTLQNVGVGPTWFYEARLPEGALPLVRCVVFAE
jgi:hypothetical protein